jgi:Cu2+-exporting ATPase
MERGRSPNAVRCLGREAWAAAPRAHGDGATTSEGAAGQKPQAGGPGAPQHGTCLSRQGIPVAVFYFRDTVRPDAREAVQNLSRRGLRLHIFSGDAPGKVSRVADELEIPVENAHGGMSPDDKRSMLETVEGHRALYLGDGANDSLAFESAWCTGTPVADRGLLQEKADFYFLGRSLRFLPRLFATARLRGHAVATVFGFAVTYNLATAAVCLAGAMNPLLAAVLMPLSSVATLAIVALAFRRSPEPGGKD